MSRIDFPTPISPSRPIMSAEDAARVLAVCRAFEVQVPPEAVEPLGDAGGFSGARLWRVTAEEAWCLRAWPIEGPTETELATIHNLMGKAAETLPFVPRLRRQGKTGRTWVAEYGTLWEMATWQPGRADFHEQPSLAKLTAAVEALALLHRVWMPSPPRYGACPAVVRRLEKLKAWQSLPRERMQAALGRIESDLRNLAVRALEAVRRGTLPAREALNRWRHIEVSLQPCLCDIWHDHVLFQGETVTGIVDFGGVRMDNPATDLARLLGSLVPEEASAWSAALDAYDRIRKLTQQERLLAEVLDWTGLIVALTNWLRWLVLGERRFANPPLAAARMRSLVLRAESERFADRMRRYRLEN